MIVPLHTFGSMVLRSGPSRNLQCLYTALRPGCSEFGMGKPYGDPAGGGMDISFARSRKAILSFDVGF